MKAVNLMFVWFQELSKRPHQIPSVVDNFSQNAHAARNGNKLQLFFGSCAHQYLLSEKEDERKLSLVVQMPYEVVPGVANVQPLYLVHFLCIGALG